MSKSKKSEVGGSFFISLEKTPLNSIKLTFDLSYIPIYLYTYILYIVQQESKKKTTANNKK